MERRHKVKADFLKMLNLVYTNQVISGASNRTPSTSLEFIRSTGCNVAVLLHVQVCSWTAAIGLQKVSVLFSFIFKHSHLNLSSLNLYSKSQVHYDKRMPPPNQVYGGPMVPHHPYGSHPGAMGSTRFSSMPEQSLDRSSPRGDEEQWKKNEKEEAVERARKRREEEEKR